MPNHTDRSLAKNAIPIIANYSINTGIGGIILIVIDCE